MVIFYSKKMVKFSIVFGLLFSVGNLMGQHKSLADGFFFDCCESYQYRPNQPNSWALFLPDSPDFEVFPNDVFSITTVINDTDEKREYCNTQSPGEWEKIDGEGPYKVTFESFNPTDGYFLVDGQEVGLLEVTLEGSDIITGISQHSAITKISPNWDGMFILFSIKVQDLANDIAFPNSGFVNEPEGSVQTTAGLSQFACPLSLLTNTIIPTNWQDTPYSITLNIDSPDNYKGMLITESFSIPIAGFTMDDLDVNWLNSTNAQLMADGLPTLEIPNEVAGYLFGTDILSVSGSFVVDANNEFVDNYSISYAENNPLDIARLEAFIFPPPQNPLDPEFKVNYSKVQNYSCSGNIIRNHTLNYRYDYRKRSVTPILHPPKTHLIFAATTK